MEEKKKRWRPSLTAYRRLENELSEYKENYKVLLDKTHCLEQSNTLLEEELIRVKKQRDELTITAAGLKGTIFRLRKRGLLARLFNKED